LVWVRTQSFISMSEVNKERESGKEYKWSGAIWSKSELEKKCYAGVSRQNESLQHSSQWPVEE
jgi:hypothetical protein